MTVSMLLETDEAQAAGEAALNSGGEVIFVPRVDDHYVEIGVIGEILERGEGLLGGPSIVVVNGQARARHTLGSVTGATEGATLWTTVEVIDEPEASEAAYALTREYRAVLENLLISRGANRVAQQLKEVTDPGRLADLAGFSPDLSFAQKIKVLETVDIEARLVLVLAWSREALADQTLRERVKADVEEGMERTQREFLLRRQLDSIHKELDALGEGDGDEDSYQTRLDALNVSEKARSAIQREIDKLERTSEQNPENGWIRTWLDTVFELPWGVESEDRLDIAEATRILDEDHDGLSDVKERILEHLAVRKLQAERGMIQSGQRGSGAILALVGPPGVGKTSLGESVARALGRKFIRVALGGVRDEAEIRGHRRTYVGSRPGRLVRALSDAGTMNPVIVLDEVDKLGADFRGDPASALLEVLDPAQNHTFRDHYLEIDLDLSRVLFLATANVVETIPAALLDRMEIIHLDGYTEAEKVDIARNHLWKRQLERAALRSGEVTVDDEALGRVIADYTREAGVRSLERELGRLLRKVATKIAAGEVATPVVVTSATVSDWLGRAKFFFEVADRTRVPGVATGLAVTGAGGDVLFVEASVADGREGLTLTGQLGDVMKESAEIALSFVRSHAEALGVDPGSFAGKRFHLHVPAGAVPKDGPSAGITMVTALVSLLTSRPVRPEVGMTGEVTLQGRVLPIGGLKQKALAAHRAGLTEVVIPIRNGVDLEDVPAEVRAQVTFHLADDIGQVLAVALGEG
jgi:ATP-dependent Lon protease